MRDRRVGAPADAAQAPAGAAKHAGCERDRERRPSGDDRCSSVPARHLTTDAVVVERKEIGPLSSQRCRAKDVDVTGPSGR